MLHSQWWQECNAVQLQLPELSWHKFIPFLGLRVFTKIILVKWG